MRKDWDEYFIGICEKVAKRATCPRKNVGAVIVRNRCIISTGYNGSIHGTEHCDKVGCLMKDKHCIRTVHAELNAILQCAARGASCYGSDIYITTFPCWGCFKSLANAGIKRIVYVEEYNPDPLVIKNAKKMGIKLKKHDESLDKNKKV